MITLLLCPVVIDHLGSLSFVIIYFGSLIFGSLLTIIFHKDDYNYREVFWGSYGCFVFGDIIATDMMLGIFFII
jgi:membrane associated rhomboid family serine protease